MNTDDASYLIAFDAATGEVAWRRERPTDAPGESPDAYTTPVVLEYDGQTQIVVSGGDYTSPDTTRLLARRCGGQAA